MCAIRLNLNDASTLKKGRYRLKLDDPTYEEPDLEKRVRKFELGELPRVDWMDKLALRDVADVRKKSTSNAMFLVVELPKFDFPVPYNEPYVMLDFKAVPAGLSPVQDSVGVKTEFLRINDPELFRDNPVENKHRRVTRARPLDRNLKPNPKSRDELQKILRYPPTHVLSQEDRDILWKFRYYLTRDKKALTKFLKSVTWSEPQEAKQAVDLLHMWADIDLDDALELLGPDFKNPAVRKFAVEQLHKAGDDELQLYLLQLVQALRFEPITHRKRPTPLGQFLISRAVKNQSLGNFFQWYLDVETLDSADCGAYTQVLSVYTNQLNEVAPKSEGRIHQIRHQYELVRKLYKLSKAIREKKASRPAKIEHLQQYISNPEHGLLNFAPQPLPLDPSVWVVGLVPRECSIFKSNMQPLRLTFRTVDSREYAIIFKTGDDLRQDQLVIQIIMLMDKLLKKENLDLKLTAYKVLATGPDQGMVQYVKSHTLASILADSASSALQGFLRTYQPTKMTDAELDDTYGIHPQVMDTYIKSCAGYCVITYLLGVGDRHLDNLLLDEEGHLFHIDFGYILGQDAKPFPPPMKLCKEMVEAMGDMSSPHYARFRSLCYTAFTTLRKSANLILNLFSLMVAANIKDIKIERDLVVRKVLDKFRLDLTEEEAIQYFQILINDSVSAMFPQVMETIHKWAQYWRK